MRGAPVTSVRQARLAGRHPDVSTVRQRQQVQLSDRMVKGFNKNAQRIAKQQGIPYDRAAAILASSTRKASPGARKKNPNLAKVKGKAGK